jgi:hypothetical protein
MNELPQGWAETTLGAIGDYWNGRGFKKSEWRPAGQGRQIIRIQDLTGSHQDPNYFDGTADERNIARKGDILVSWAATLGIFEWPGPEAVINQHIFRVSCCFRGSICLQVTSRVRIGSGSVVPGATLRRRSMTSPSPRPELESGVGRRPSENRSEAEARSGP